MSLAWSAVFLWVLADDAASIHERLGEQLGARLGLPALAGLDPQDLGELLVMAAAGGLALLLVGAAHRGTRGPERQLSWRLLALLALLAGFGVGLDMAASALRSGWLGFVEDGGEMIGVSLLLATVRRRLTGTASRTPVRTP